MRSVSVLWLCLPLCASACFFARSKGDTADTGAAPADGGGTAVDTGTPAPAIEDPPVDPDTAADSGSSADTGEAADPGTGGGDGATEGALPDELALRFTAVVVPEGSETTTARAQHDLTWEGEVLQGVADGVVAVQGRTLYATASASELRVEEERIVSLQLELPAAEVVAGATLEGTLLYGENPVEPTWLDVLLGATVQVEVRDDPDHPGALALLVAEASLEPWYDVGVMRAGMLYEGPYDLAIAPEPTHACTSLTAAQRTFVEQDLAELAADQREVFLPVDYAALGRGGQGGDPMKPFLFSADLVNHLTSWNGTYSPGRVADSGGIVRLTLLPPTVPSEGYESVAPMDLRQGAGLSEVGRRVTIDGRAWLPGFPVTVERFYATSEDTLLDAATCVTTHAGMLQTFSG